MDLLRNIVTQEETLGAECSVLFCLRFILRRAARCHRVGALWNSAGKQKCADMASYVCDFISWAERGFLAGAVSVPPVTWHLTVALGRGVPYG